LHREPTLKGKLVSNPFSGNGGGVRDRIPVRQVCTVLYEQLPSLDPGMTEARLRQVVGPCSVEWSTIGQVDPPVSGGVAEFGEHRVAMVALNAPVREEVLSLTVGVSPMPEDVRRDMMEHGAAIRLLYIGESDDPIEQLTAMYSVAGVLLLQNGLGIINERAALAQPAELAYTYLPQLGAEVPPISLWTGVVTYSMGESAAGNEFLMRTYGMDQVNLPELAMYMSDRRLADDVYHALINTCLYQVQGRPALHLGVGDRVEFRGRMLLLSDPGRTGPEFASETGLLLLVEV
jgi:hypothetical protein